MNAFNILLNISKTYNLAIMQFALKASSTRTVKSRKNHILESRLPNNSLFGIR